MSERLGELDRLKQDFVSNVSHDLKAPLASMLETTRLLLDEVPGALNPRQRRLLGLNQECGARLTSMITNVLDLARLDAGGVRYRFAQCDLERVVRDAMKEVAALAEKKALDTTVEVEGGPLRLAGDENLLRRAFTNLLSNAVKFTPEGSRMGSAALPLCARARRWLAGSAPTATAHSGADAGMPQSRGGLRGLGPGPGCPEAQKEKVFERFTGGQARAATSDRACGLEPSWAGGMRRRPRRSGVGGGRETAAGPASSCC